MKSPVSFLCTALFASVAGGATVEILTEGWTDADIFSAMVSVRCSTNQPDRIPQITFCYDDALTAKAIRLNPVAKEGRWESQAFDTNPDRHAKGLRLALAETGTAVWTVRSIVLDYEGSLARADPSPGFVIFIK